MDYQTALMTLAELNLRIYKHKGEMPSMNAPVEAFHKFNEEKAALIAEGKAHGFKRIFDGSFCLDLKKFPD